MVNVLTNLNHRSNLKFVGIGFDISREGIKIASAGNSDNIWLIADLAHSPFKNNQFDIIVNILSPANYSEFRRILKKEGLLIKVLPNPGYLMEIRKLFYSGKEKNEYSNKKTFDLLIKNFNPAHQERVIYKKEVKPDSLIPLLEMTPLCWNINKEKLNKNKWSEIREVTIDLKLISAKNY